MNGRLQLALGRAARAVMRASVSLADVGDGTAPGGRRTSGAGAVMGHGGSRRGRSLRGAVARLLVSMALLALLGGEAAAQDVVVLVVEAGVSVSERDAIAAALREELGLEVREEASAGRGELALRISVRGDEAQLEVDRLDRARIERTVVLPRDPEARLHTLVTLAVNLTRDEAAELLAGLQARVAPDETAPSDLGASEEASTSEEVPAETASAALSAEADANLAPRTEARGEAAVVSAEEAEDATPVLDDPWRHRVFRLGAGAHLGTAPEAGGGVVPWTLYGVDLVVAPLPELAFGLRDLGVMNDGRGAVLNFGPVVEGALRLLPLLDLHAILGCDLQAELRDGGGMAVAPRLGLGARLYPDPIFSLALDVTGRVVATDVFHTTASNLPSGAILLTIGVSFAFHVG